MGRKSVSIGLPQGIASPGPGHQCAETQEQGRKENPLGCSTKVGFRFHFQKFDNKIKKGGLDEPVNSL